MSIAMQALNIELVPDLAETLFHKLFIDSLQMFPKEDINTFLGFALSSRTAYHAAMAFARKALTVTFVDDMVGIFYGSYQIGDLSENLPIVFGKYLHRAAILSCQSAALLKDIFQQLPNLSVLKVWQALSSEQIGVLRDVFPNIEELKTSDLAILGSEHPGIKFPFLKTLGLIFGNYANDIYKIEMPANSCPLLEHLVFSNSVEFDKLQNLIFSGDTFVTVKTVHLRHTMFHRLDDTSFADFVAFISKFPSLKTTKITKRLHWLTIEEGIDELKAMQSGFENLTINIPVVLSLNVEYNLYERSKVKAVRALTSAGFVSLNDYDDSWLLTARMPNKTTFVLFNFKQ
uniref:F-box domain-containing protein n=1 Tax=Panagrellus redivivus TaxID=6233 RepID=A0A7E4UX28_PANRE